MFPDEELPTIGFRGNTKITFPPQSESKRYYIIARYSFFVGTYGAERNGALRKASDGWYLTTKKEIGGYPCHIYMMETREMAMKEIQRIAGQSLYQHSPNTYSCGTSYDLRHGEYAMPTYTIIKTGAK